MNDFRAPQLGLEIFGGVVPEQPGRLVGSMSQTWMKIWLANPARPRGPIRVPISIAKGGIEKVLVLGVNLGQVMNQAIGKVAATGLLFSRLADIETNFHVAQFSL